MPYGETLDTMKTYLPNLKTFDDMPVSEWVKKAENAKEEFAAKIDDDKDTVQKKESL